MKLTISHREKIKYPLHKIEYIVCDLDKKFDKTYAGIDPGYRHLGLSVIHANRAYVFEINPNKVETDVHRILLVYEVLNMCIALLEPRWLQKGVAIVEGASYAKTFGQVDLANARCMAIWFLHQKGMDVRTSPPSTIRKDVFGNGRTLAHNVYEGIPANAAASLSCAVMASMIKLPIDNDDEE